MGVRAEVEETVGRGGKSADRETVERDEGSDDWIEVGIEMAGQVGRDEEGGIVFLGEMLREGVLDCGALRRRLVVNRRWHWRLFVDVSG